MRSGAAVEPDTVVARTELPGNIQTVNLAGKLAMEPHRALAALLPPMSRTKPRRSAN